MGISTDNLINELKSNKEALRLKAAKHLQQLVTTGMWFK